MLNLFIETGETAVAPEANEIESSALGVRFVSYRNHGRFEEQIDDLGPGLIVWPGGDLAESRDDRYGLEYDELYNETIDRPGLTDMMASAVEADAALAIVLPTVRYVGREDDLATDVSNFMGKLLGGEYGPFPKEIILEVGSEYYAHFSDDGSGAEAAYASVADTMITEIASAMADPGVNPDANSVTIAVQAGRSLEDDEDIRDGLSEFALEHTDMIIHHRFPHQAQGFDNRIDEVAQIKDAWTTDVTDAGGEDPELFVSAWNVAQLTRTDAVNDFLDANDHLSADDIDLEARTNTDFENYWQSLLQGYDYGAQHPAAILEGFSTYAEAGMSAGAAFGVDVMHPGRLSWRTETGEDQLYLGGEALKMIYESVDGTKVLESDEPFDRDASAHTYAFESEDKLIVFVAAGSEDVGTTTIEIDGLQTEFSSLWADRLEAQENPDWMVENGVADNPDVDETPEAETYLFGTRSEASVVVEDDTLQVQLNAYDVIRLAFAKTEDAADAIQQFSTGSEIDLATGEVVPDDPGLPASSELDTDDDTADEDDDDGDAGGVSGLITGVILPVLFFLV